MHRLTVLVAQVGPLVEPVRLAGTPDYAGCTSLVQLPVSPGWAGSVHNDAALQLIAEGAARSVSAPALQDPCALANATEPEAVGSAAV
jgi:hypothetical protein